MYRIFEGLGNIERIRKTGKGIALAARLAGIIYCMAHVFEYGCRLRRESRRRSIHRLMCADNRAEMRKRMIDLKKLECLKEKLEAAEAVVIGAGAGLSVSAGFVYTGKRLHTYFQDFTDKYGFRDMYSGGFYPFASQRERWAYWSRYIYINRYMDAPKPVYQELYGLVKKKDSFVVTTNVDHQFQKAGFDKERLFYTQGDYGLFQCSAPCHHKTYDNEGTIRKMLKAQGYVTEADGTLTVPDGVRLKMEIPGELVPLCPVCHKPMSMNLRADSTFVEDSGWRRASGRYQDFLERHRNQQTLFLELGVGYNTPGIVKYPFWQMTYRWKNAFYVCVNAGDAAAPGEIEKKSLCIDGDIGDILYQLSV